jgi:hypothetical protein
MTSMLQTTQASGDEMDVLFYETQMMNRAFASLRTASTDVFKNALLESFLLHLRNLIYFFREPNPKFPDDLTYAAFRDSKGDTLKPICLKRTRCNQQTLTAYDNGKTTTKDFLGQRS